MFLDNRVTEHMMMGVGMEMKTLRQEQMCSGVGRNDQKVKKEGKCGEAEECIIIRVI